eukprot:TRINITY_DN66953_c6_g1_i2.p2 TRINITY_DN66953_c6_g1~~TRINITY_DN66953_c6_g1_i2.p2  ORF type:complete len:277 (+),score=161.89 TRINITY_DN66953_c6_g1_i2:220-1050(+)
MGLIGSTGPAAAYLRPPAKQYEWRLSGALVVERLPTLTREKHEVEVAMEEMQDRVAQMTHIIPPHELTEDLERKELEKMYAEQEGVESTEEEFVPAPRKTEDDESGNVHSTNRALDQSLYLLVKRAGRDGEYAWQFPQQTWLQGETMRETAERALEEVCGEDLSMHVLGNAPIGHVEYEHEPREREVAFVYEGDAIDDAAALAEMQEQQSEAEKNSAPYDATKVFFYHALYMVGDVQPNPDFADDYMWATRDQLRELLPSNTLAVAEDMLMDSQYY